MKMELLLHHLDMATAMAVAQHPPPLPSLAPTSPPPLSFLLPRRKLLTHGASSLLCSLALQSSPLLPHPALASSFGISGPKEWLKGQKKKAADFLLAPIIASRDRLNTVRLLLTETSSQGDFSEAQKLVRIAARDCILPEPGSFVAFQIQTGVEVCTFRLILKNAASLLDDTDPVKLKADAALNHLISSFASLDEQLANVADTSFSRNNVNDAIKQTTEALDSFERGVRECIGIA